MSLLFRYGTWLPGLPREEITSASADKLLLIACVSFNRVGSEPAPDEDSLSLPARSTRFSTPEQLSFVIAFRPVSRSENTEWEREERSFISVAATARRFLAFASRECTSSGRFNGTALVSMCT